MTEFPSARMISDHALVRWLERVHGIDMDFFRQELADQVGDAIRAGAVSLKVQNMEFRISNKRLVTVIAKGKARSGR